MITFEMVARPSSPYTAEVTGSSPVPPTSKSITYSLPSSRAGADLLHLIQKLGFEICRQGLVVEPEEAEIVRMVFELAERGETNSGIARALNDDGLERRNGKPWTPRQVGVVLQRQAFYRQGAIRYGEVTGQNAQPGLLELGAYSVRLIPIDVFSMPDPVEVNLTTDHIVACAVGPDLQAPLAHVFAFELFDLRGWSLGATLQLFEGFEHFIVDSGGEPFEVPLERRGEDKRKTGWHALSQPGVRRVAPSGTVAG